MTTKPEHVVTLNNLVYGHVDEHSADWESATTSQGYVVALSNHYQLWWAETNLNGVRFVVAATSRDLAVIRISDRIQVWIDAQPTERINGEIK